jgi:hypothetical protein
MIYIEEIPQYTRRRKLYQTRFYWGRLGYFRSVLIFFRISGERQLGHVFW